MPRPLTAIALFVCASLACSKTTATASPAFTLHYHRALADYDGWTAQVSGGAAESSATSSAKDGFGAVYALTVKPGATALTFTLNNGANADAAGTLSVDVSGSVREAWVVSGSATAIARKLPALPADGKVAIYYLRGDNTYSGWGLHTWGDQVTETQWGAPLSPAGIDPDYGAGFLLDLKAGGPAKDCPPGQVCLIVHKGDMKDPGPNMNFDPKALGNLVFLVTGSQDISTVPRKVGEVSLSGASAHLIARDTLAFCYAKDATQQCITDPAATSFELRYSPTADIKVTASDASGGLTIALTARPSGLTTAQQDKAPYLTGWPVFDIAPAQLPALRDALKGQIIAVARKADGKPIAATQVQNAFALDDLYAYEGPLGITFSGQTPTFLLWAPTAQSVKLHVYDTAKASVSAVDMTQSAQGVWSYTGTAAWYGLYYRYDLSVYHPATSKIEQLVTTDPWAANLSTNGLFAQIIDLADPALKPAGWDSLAKPALDAPEDMVVYESHVRDFSATDTTVSAANRGKYLAFTESNSNGMKHLAALSAAGLTHVHLLPAFDFATVDEDAANRVDIDKPFSALCAKNTSVPAALCTQFGSQTIAQAMASFAGDSDQQQAIANYLRGIDSFNWGYDPFHYGAPEGSYASTAEGSAKILEFRRMVQGLAGAGLRVFMDVVYNHTNASGPQSDKSVLDKVVPWYYHRLDPQTGFVLTSSCCSNTATEHRMMERLMIDTLVRWARDYKVDGFRFDLMGLHLKQDLIGARDALAALTVASDGVDGSKIYLYGEGWEMGETAKRARGINANQPNMAGTGIGTFNDRIRDAVRGGGPFDNGNDLRKNQGFANGLYTDRNELAAAPTDLRPLDWLRISMAGNLTDFRLVNASDVTVPGGAVGYGGAGAGYTDDPQEAINYVSVHDNQVLWDIMSYKMPSGRSMSERVRAFELALDTALLGEGIPFVHMGDDLLRSKSMDKNSYDSGDWFNRVDWSGQSNGWKSGLPNSGDDSGNWPLIRTIFADSSIAPGAADISAASAHFVEMLKVRKSSPLFRLRTKSDVMKRVDFLNTGSSQVQGVIVMTITDGTCAGADLDPQRDALVVILNADKVSRTTDVPGAAGFTLHSLLQADSNLSGASASGTSFTVPARSAAVFEKLQPGAQGAGLPCNTR